MKPSTLKRLETRRARQKRWDHIALSVRHSEPFIPADVLERFRVAVEELRVLLGLMPLPPRD
jgi:hypothetical protein